MTRIMKNSFKNFSLTLLCAFVFSACNDLSNEVEQRLDQLNSKAQSLDSLINKEVDKVLALDSLIIRESDKVKELDSLITRSSSKIDSISTKGSKILERFTN